MRIVQIIPDNRDVMGQHDRDAPFFGPAIDALLQGFERLDDAIDMHVVSCVRHPLPAPEVLAGNVRYHQVLVPGGYRRTLFIAAARKVRSVIREIAPDVVHGQGTEEYAALCAAFSGLPNVVTVHGNMRRVARRRRYRPFVHMVVAAASETIALSKAGAVFCNSSYTDRCVRGLNGIRPRVPNAVRAGFFDVRPDGPRTGPLICVGNILPYKNQLGLIAALESQPEITATRLVFAGRCNPASAYGARFRNAVAARPWCDYIGPLEEDDLLALLADSAGLVHPSLEESFGLAIAEAQAAGVPVAASAIGGITDLVAHRETGLLFDPRDPADIRRHVEDLLQGRHDDMVAAARTHAERHYRPDVVARMHTAYYRDMPSTASG